MPYTECTQFFFSKPEFVSFTKMRFIVFKLCNKCSLEFKYTMYN